MALFNLIPGFPLDGGRIFRSVIWIKNKDYLKATRIATLVGRVIGYIFIAGGILLIIITREWTSGIWISFIGWFLETSANASYRDAVLRNTLQNYSARDIIDNDCRVISRDISIEQLVKHYILPTGYRCFIVSSFGKAEGLITTQNIKKIPQNRWNTTSVTEIMNRIDNLAISNGDQNALSLLEHMQENKLDQVLVLDDGNIVGLITFNNLFRITKTLSDLKIKNAGDQKENLQ
jgi:predicted transcriptional regulator